MKCPNCSEEVATTQDSCPACNADLATANGRDQHMGGETGETAPSPEETVEQLRRELTEAREQQTATSEILGVISSSPTDVQPVFDAVVRSAVRLCSALYGFVSRFDGEVMHIAV
jgi:hypothetical protein